MADFTREDLAGSRFEQVDLAGARFRNVDLTGAVIRGALLVNVEIDGLIQDVTINGVDVVPLVEAELDRRYPDRAKMRPADADGFRQAWDILEPLWQQTVARARAMPPDLLHERVDDEWSFIETLRHLVFATDAWVSRAILGQPSPWDPLGLPHDEMPDETDVPWDKGARPSLDQVLALRADRMATVRQVLAGLTDAKLAGWTEPVTAPGYPASESFAVRRCLQAILTEEWEHRLFAERDLAVLESRLRPEGAPAGSRACRDPAGACASGRGVGDRRAEDVGIAERGRAVLLRGRPGDRRAGTQRHPPRVQGRAVRGRADVVPHADRAGPGGGGVDIIAEELRGEVVLRRCTRVTDHAAGQNAERADRPADDVGVQDHADQAPGGAGVVAVRGGERIVGDVRVGAVG